MVMVNTANTGLLAYLLNYSFKSDLFLPMRVERRNYVWITCFPSTELGCHTLLMVVIFVHLSL